MTKVGQKRNGFKGLSHSGVPLPPVVTIFLALPRKTLVKMLTPSHVLPALSSQTSKERGLWSSVPVQVLQS